MTGTDTMEPALIDMLLDQAGRLIGDHVDREALHAAEAGTWPQALWDSCAALGLPEALEVGAEDGGLSFADAGALFSLLGAEAVPLPLGETILARLVLARAGLPAPDGAIGFLATPCGEAAFGAHLAHVVVASGAEVRLHAVSGARETRPTIAREGQALLDLSAATPLATAPWPQGLPEAGVLLALLTASRIAGGLAKVLALTVEYALVRHQFARPIGRFQAVQQIIAQLAAEAAAVQSVADAAWAALDKGGDVPVMAAIARIRAGEAIPQACAIAHQVHGAIGITDEHKLHYHTRRLWQWRRDHGSDAYWAEWLGRELERSGGDFWTMLTTRCGVSGGVSAA